MKKLVSVQEVDNEGLISLLGEEVELWCFNYIYTGTLVGVNDTCCLLEHAKVVYETGPLSEKGFKDAQACKYSRYIMLSAIESFSHVV